MTPRLSVPHEVVEAVWAYLAARPGGAAGAVRGEELARRFGLSGVRRIKEVASCLAAEGRPIGSGAKGYYRLRTRAEYERADRFLETQIRSLAVRRAALRRAAEADGLLGWEAPLLPHLDLERRAA